MHYIFGAWYRGDEIARRGGVFYVGLTLGTLTAGLIQAGASSSLHDINGLAGWRWMYIICAIITIPIGYVFVTLSPPFFWGCASLQVISRPLQGKLLYRTVTSYVSSLYTQ